MSTSLFSVVPAMAVHYDDCLAYIVSGLASDRSNNCDEPSSRVAESATQHARKMVLKGLTLEMVLMGLSLACVMPHVREMALKGLSLACITQHVREMVLKGLSLASGRCSDSGKSNVFSADSAIRQEFVRDASLNARDGWFKRPMR